MADRTLTDDPPVDRCPATLTETCAVSVGWTIPQVTQRRCTLAAGHDGPHISDSYRNEAAGRRVRRMWS